MGDRVSIQFVNGTEKSVVLFSHWGGMDFVKSAQLYANNLGEETRGRISYPLDRKEPATVMVDFIRYFTCDMQRVDGNYYLGATDADGDNCDNGHYEIDLSEV